MSTNKTITMSCKNNTITVETIMRTTDGNGNYIDDISSLRLEKGKAEAIFSSSMAINFSAGSFILFGDCKGEVAWDIGTKPSMLPAKWDIISKNDPQGLMSDIDYTPNSNFLVDLLADLSAVLANTGLEITLEDLGITQRA